MIEKQFSQTLHYILLNINDRKTILSNSSLYLTEHKNNSLKLFIILDRTLKIEKQFSQTLHYI